MLMFLGNRVQSGDLVYPTSGLRYLPLTTSTQTVVLEEIYKIIESAKKCIHKEKKNLCKYVNTKFIETS